MSRAQEMGKAYEPQGVEERIYAEWLESGYFNPDNLPGERKEMFSLVLPPPNVTGTLHMGHATMLAIEDAMVRFARLRGKKTLWLPGTDHAAIATQSKVEGIIKKEEGKSRHDLGREAFLSRVRAFAQESHDTIVNQCKKMGSSLDWSREAYTLDDARNKAVNTAFKRMYDDGLIYRGNRMVNWDPKGQTTISDDEMVYVEEKTTFYYFQYGPFVIGTARPETKFGDKYVVVHPDDARYASYKHGDKLTLEWINGPIEATIIKDTAIDPEFGTGVMTITPWHSAVDFDIAERHGLDKEQIIDEQGTLLPIAGEFAGMHIKDARAKIVEKLRAKGLLVKEEEYTHQIATAERTGEVIEPQIKLQWFVAVNKEFDRDGKKVTLKSLMQEAVRSKAIEILPDRFEKTYFHWIDNLRDWCISRQIWFGHRIPVWYRGEEIAVGEAPAGEGWMQDEDTLDTWFSSGLWTFSTLGWPDLDAKDLKTFHPTSVLETGYDILFFWVARMVLMSTYLVGEVPFKTVYLHGLVRDEQGRKMSKSLGNIIDPLTMITKYGADATRLSLVMGSSPGNDVKLSEEKIAGFRNFTNKLWNISRFVLTSVSQPPTPHTQPPVPKTLADRWILSRFAEVTEKVTEMHESYDLSLAGEILRDFTWSEFADWYLEIAKVEGKYEVEGLPSLHTEKEEILLFMLERLLVLWHPFMPFVTEEIYKQWDNGLIMVAPWPEASTLAHYCDEAAEKQFAEVQEVIVAIRNIRAQYKVDQKATISVAVEALFMASHASNVKIIEKMCRATIEQVESIPTEGVAKAVVGSMIIAVSLAGLVDVAKERERLLKEIASVEKFVTALDAKLANAEFTARAPEAVIIQEQQKLVDARARLEALRRELASVAQ